MNCPKCNSEITFFHIFSALNPAYMKCKSCKVRLVGNWLIQVQVVLAIILGILLGFFLVTINYSIEMRLVMFVMGVLIIAIPNVFATIKFGAYNVKNGVQ